LLVHYLKQFQCTVRYVFCFNNKKGFGIQVGFMCPQMFPNKIEVRGAKIRTYLTERSARLNWAMIEGAGLNIYSTTMIDCNAKTDNKFYKDGAINTWKTICDTSKLCRVVECEGNHRNLKSTLFPWYANLQATSTSNQQRIHHI
jgi:hypothetical protein